MENNKFYITTPIYYPSANFHIGHCYTTIIADAIARFKRLQGYDVFFLTGTDEHGLKIENKAKEVNKTPKEYVDEIVLDAKDLWKSLGISYDKFIRTTDDYHVKAVSNIFNKLYEKGDIYKGYYEGLYCTPCESFWTSKDLIDGCCPDCHREVKKVKEEAYFFKLSKYEDRIRKLLDNKDFLLPESRKNEMINNFLDKGLDDLCVSRTSFTWGIPVSFDKRHVVYVWLDALTNYLTALGYETGDDDSLFKKYWPCDLHLVGKEIVRFHAIIWPAILMALDLPFPKQIFAHGWLKINGEKISKSLGNYKDPREYIKTYGVDAVRYFALREVPFGNDGSFDEEYLKQRRNTDLCNTLGNLLNRTIAMTYKYFDGVITNTKVNEDIDKDLIDSVTSLKEIVENDMSKYNVSLALEDIFNVLKACNKYIDDTMPWNLAKLSNYDRLQTVLYNILESIRICSIYLSAFIPDTSKAIFKQLNTDKTTYDTTSKFGYLEDNHKLGEASILFERI